MDFHDASTTDFLSYLPLINNYDDQLRFQNLIPAIGNLYRNQTQDNLENQINRIQDTNKVLMKLIRINTLDKSSMCRENCDLCNDMLVDIVKMLDQFSSDELIIIQTYTILMMLMSDSIHRQQLVLIMENSLNIIIESMKKYQEKRTPIEMACRVIRNLASNDEVAAQLIQEGIGEVIISIIDCQKSDLVVIEAAMWAIVNLSYDCDIATILGSIGIIEKIVQVLDESRQVVNLSLDKSIYSAVRNLLCSPTNFGLFASSNIYEAIGHSIRQYPEDVDFLQIVSWCAINLACNQHASSRLYSNKVPQSIVESCVQSHHTIINDIELGPMAEATLFSIKTFSVLGSVDERLDLIRLGADELIRSFLIRYVDREGMVEACCNALSALCRGNQTIKRMVNGLNGLHDKKDPIMNLKSSGVFKSEAEPHGCVELILRAAKQHAFVPETVETCAKVLVFMTDDPNEDMEVIELVKRSEACGQLIAMLDHHKADGMDLLLMICQLILQVYYVHEPSSSIWNQLVSSHCIVEDEDSNNGSKKRWIVHVPTLSEQAVNFDQIYNIWQLKDLLAVDEK